MRDSNSYRPRTGLGQDGFTVVELLITSTIFVVILVAVGSLLISSSQAYTVTTVRTEAIQDSEAVLQLMRYEVALAGYRGLAQATYDRPFSSGATDSIVVTRGGTGDQLTVRYFEDRYLSSGDTGERVVTFRVDGDQHTLVRVEGRPSGGSTTYTTELLVGNIASMEVLAVIDRFRAEYPIADLIAGTVEGPETMAGVNMRITFVDGLVWDFLIGVSNTQTYAIAGG